MAGLGIWKYGRPEQLIAGFGMWEKRKELNICLTKPSNQDSDYFKYSLIMLKVFILSEKQEEAVE